ncbi:sugar phosphate isomerase/epimerase [Sphingobium sp. CFD-1]|uniref:sugar phosphate isomerase/epimerase family protein n=1 Tax=Sphingobium sp. CFD-1 TaxID=2878545 RepID=UPI00214B83F9|nr:sugar phosphate isomerase/epimerase family protein [Sphingobium sp. CFD-1]
MNRIGVDYISLIGISPLGMITAAADAGCHNISLILTRPDYNPDGYPWFSLIDDAALRRETVTCLRDRDVSIALVDGFAVYPDQPTENHRQAFEILAELGVRRVNTVSFDEDWSRMIDKTAEIVAMAREYDVTVTIESCPMLTVKTLAQALEVISAVNLPNFKLLIDTMHITRSGESGDIARLDPVLIDYVQISDGPLSVPDPLNYMNEAMNERMVPGTGEMPLVEMIRAMRRDIIVSIEVPMRSLKEAGMSETERVRLAVEGARKVVAAAEA